jgi:hypothetical protein
MKKIYRFLGKYNLLFTCVNIPVGLLLGLALRRCIDSHLWVLSGICIFAILFWLVVLVISCLLVDRLIYEIKEETLAEIVELATNHIAHLTVAKLDSYAE